MRIPRTTSVATLALALALTGAACGSSGDQRGATTVPSTDATGTTDTTAADSASEAVIHPGDGGEYAPEIDPADFVDVVDNPYPPLPTGARWVYEGDGERVEVVVTDERREILGIEATVVRDTVTDESGQLVEDTFDWFAQDGDGNVWYFGEEVANYENGVLADHDGSWEAGVDGALPGIVMYADPATHVGETFRQEYYAGEAEDMAKVLSTTEQITVPFGSFENVVQTEDWTPLEPGLREQKYYAPGVGVIKEVNLTTGNDIVLLEMTTP